MTPSTPQQANSTHDTSGIVLFAHGSRDPLWHKPMDAVADQIRISSPQCAVVCAYLEFSTPDLATATQGLIARGLRTIVIIPMFLGVGRHAREDLPQLVDALRKQHPSVTFSLRPAVGEDPRLVQLLAEIALSSISP